MKFVQHKDVIRVLKLNGIVGRPAVMLAADQQAIPSWADRKSEICQTEACTGDPQDRAARNTKSVIHAIRMDLGPTGTLM